MDRSRCAEEIQQLSCKGFGSCGTEASSRMRPCPWQDRGPRAEAAPREPRALLLGHRVDVRGRPSETREASSQPRASSARPSPFRRTLSWGSDRHAQCSNEAQAADDHRERRRRHRRVRRPKSDQGQQGIHLALAHVCSTDVAWGGVLGPASAVPAPGREQALVCDKTMCLEAARWRESRVGPRIVEGRGSMTNSPRPRTLGACSVRKPAGKKEVQGTFPACQSRKP